MHDFTQFGFSEEACAAANEILEFTACMRADGSVYGTSGQCRKGTETQKKPNLHLKAYIRLMKKARERGKPADTKGYHEHHAFPKSIFTNKETANKKTVWLTHGEHFAAHHMIYRALKDRYGDKDQRTIKMGHAIAKMATDKKGVKLNKKQYEVAMKIQAKLIAAKNKERWKDPKERKRQGEAIRENFKDEVFRKNFGDRMKQILADPEIRAQRAELRKKDWQKESYRNNIKQARANKKWYNNGVDNIRLQPHEKVPEGYAPGRFQTPEQKANRAKKLRETAERKKRQKEQQG